MEEVQENLPVCVSEIIDQATQNVDRYISVPNGDSDFITGMTVFVDL